MTEHTTAPAWTRKPDAVQTMARFCAPTVLAALMGVPRLEAAELLLSIPGMPFRKTGGVLTSAWHRFLVEDLGGTDVSHHDIEDASTGRSYWPTVAMFCRAFPQGTFVIHVNGHTLLLQDGGVLADTMPTNSKRARVLWAVRMPTRAEGLPADEAQVLEERERQHKADMAQRRERRERQRQRRKEIRENPSWRSGGEEISITPLRPTHRSVHSVVRGGAAAPTHD